MVCVCVVALVMLVRQRGGGSKSGASETRSDSSARTHDPARAESSRRSASFRGGVELIPAGAPPSRSASETSPEPLGPTPEVGYFTNDDVPVRERQQTMTRLARERPAEAVGVLDKLGKGASVVILWAIPGLARSRDPVATRYLTKATGHEGTQVRCAAICALAEATPDEAVPIIDGIMTSDELQEAADRDEIRETCIKALGETASSEALPVLTRELRGMIESDASKESDDFLELGSLLVEAVSNVGDSRGAEILTAYADELQADLSGDPRWRRYQMLKIVEARETAEELR